MIQPIWLVLRRRIFAASLGLATLAATCATGATRPNVIVIMADDLGAEGLGCYGSTIYTTPNLDRMATEGIRFNNAYATPLCTPTRVMIMSGLYPMALVHSPFEHPPKLGELARTRSISDLDKKVVAWGHMITYMDNIVGKIMERLKANGLEKNTLVLFTGDNGTHASLVSKLPGMELEGGKGSFTEAGCRVPFMAWWPGTIKPAVKDEVICLVDVLPTICAIAGIGLTSPVDGMDLSHYFLGTEGKDRDQVLMCFKKGYFVRDKRFRLHEDGTLYDIPVTSDKERYSEARVAQEDFSSDRQRLGAILDQFRSIEPESKPLGKSKGKRSKVKSKSAPPRKENKSE